MSGWFLLDNLIAVMGLKGAVAPTDNHLSGEQIEADIAYADSVVRNYCVHGAATGKVAEIGPGGSALTGLMLIDRGADRVELLDRFAYAHSQSALDRAYALTIERSERLKQLFPRPTELAPRIAFASGEDAAAERYFLDHSGYDSICSCAVFEHLMDPIAALAGAASALNPGGVLVHYVDFRDHGMFTAGGAHELTFLKVPGWLYPAMSRARGRPNRVLIDRYRAACDALDLDYRILATSLVGVGSIDETPVDEIPADLRARANARVLEIRDQLASPYRDMPVEDLAIDGIALIAHRKPAPGPARGR
jgi:SAM-dependent methyltransferase